MKNALISPEEKVYKYDGTLLGDRVAQVSDSTFEIAPPLFWVKCADDVVADQFYFEATTNSILEVPVPPPKSNTDNTIV
jgi:hypothetical protein